MDVDEDSKELLTIYTHKGLYRYNRLHYSVKSVSDILKQTMDAMLTGLTGAAAFIDRIIFASTTQNDLLKRLFSVFKRIQQ